MRCFWVTCLLISIYVYCLLLLWPYSLSGRSWSTPNTVKWHVYRLCEYIFNWYEFNEGDFIAAIYYHDHHFYSCYLCFVLLSWLLTYGKLLLVYLLQSIEPLLCPNNMHVCHCCLQFINWYVSLSGRNYQWHQTKPDLTVYMNRPLRPGGLVRTHEQLTWASADVIDWTHLSNNSSQCFTITVYVYSSTYTFVLHITDIFK